MSVPIGAMDGGSHNALLELTSSGMDAPWPPDTAGEISYGPQTTLLSVSGTFGGSGWDPPWGFIPATEPAPDSSMFPVGYSQTVASWTWDVSNADVDAMDECVLTLQMMDGSPPGLGWIFGLSGLVGDDEALAFSGPNWSNTTLVSIAWIGGSFDDLDDYGDIFTARATTWPWAPDPETDEPYLAGSINLLDFVTPIASPNTTVDRLEIPLADWEYWLSTYDWVSLLFTTAVQPQHFWLWQDFEQFDDESNPYIGRNWVPFNPQSFLFSGHPFDDVTISIVPLVTDIAIAAIVSMGGLTVRGSPASVPMEPRDAAPPTSHAARRFRDAHR